MSKQIEIYVRPSGDRILLNFYIPDELRDAFIAGLRTGSFEPADTKMNLEFSVLPEWLKQGDRRESQSHESGDLHVRLAVSSINTHFGD